MFLDQLPKTTTKSKRRVGRGYGSTLGGHTAGRGQKGQKARTKIHPAFMGTKVKKSLLQRLPLMRGKGKFKPLSANAILINVDELAVFASDQEVTIKSLQEAGILKKDLAPKSRVKLLARGSINLPLKVMIPVSKGAAKLIEEAGGSVIREL